MKETLTLLLTTSIIFCYINAAPVAPLPGPTVTVQGASPSCTNPCSGSDSAIVTNGVKPYHYLWMPGGDTTPAIYNLCSGQYIVIVTDSLGDSATDTSNLSLPPVPQVSITSTGDSIAGADSTRLCATPVYPHYLWSNNDTTQCIYVLNEGLFYVTVTDSNNCQGVSNDVFIYKCPAPDITVVISGDTLYANGGYNACHLSYILLLNDTPVTGAGNVLVLPGPGNYELLVTGDSTCCGIDSSTVIYQWSGTYTGTGINEISNNAPGLCIYPNPATGSIQLQYGNLHGGTGIEIYNPLGQLVQQQAVKQPGVQRLDISSLLPGLYLVTIKQDNAIVASGKMVKCN